MPAGRTQVLFLVDFGQGIEHRFARYFDLKESLDTLPGRPVVLWPEWR